MSNRINLFSVIAAAAAVIFMSSCRDGAVEIVYDQPLSKAKEMAAAAGKDLYVVLSRPDCPPCAQYINSLDNRWNRKLSADAIFNVVDVLQPENYFYQEWLCMSGYPTTCVFSSDGTLKGVISGASRSAMDCIESARKGEAKCVDYLYGRHYPIEGDYLAMLDKMLACKEGLERGEDVGEALSEILSRTNYPYPVYLKMLNEEKQGRHAEAVVWANRMFDFDKAAYYIIYTQVYGELFQEAKHVIDPEYMPEDDGVIEMEEEIILADCRVDKVQPLTVHIRNTGTSQVAIHNVQMSCTCMKVVSPVKQSLEPGEEMAVHVEFTGDSEGEFYREVMVYSDSSEPLKRVAVRATVKA